MEEANGNQDKTRRQQQRHQADRRAAANVDARTCTRNGRICLELSPGNWGEQYLIRRLAYRIQELVHGGLSREARKQLKELVQESGRQGQESKRRRLICRLERDCFATGMASNTKSSFRAMGFNYNGKTYRSLSAVARAITGRHCGGRRFFGLKPGEKRGSPK